MRAQVLTLAMFGLGWVGCGNNDVCHRGPAVCADTQGKEAACPTLATSLTCQAFSAAEMQKCEDSLKSCSAADLSAINAWYDCIERVPACVNGQQNSFQSAVAACPLPNQTAGCLVYQ